MFLCGFFFFFPDKADDDLEMTMVCHRPEGLDQLEAQTNFSKRELQVLYRGFKNVSDHAHFMGRDKGDRERAMSTSPSADSSPFFP